MQMTSAASTAAVNTDCTFGNTSGTEVEQMYDAVLKLTTSPGFFYDYINPLMESLNNVDSVDVLSACVNVIIEQALLEPNFTYSGARLCNYLCENLQTKVKHSKSDNVFRKVMLDRLKELHMGRQELISSDENKLQGLLMFMGELFIQMELVREVFFSKILEVIKTLVDSPSDGNLKCVAQLFKMAGSLLEVIQQEKGIPGQITLQTIFDQLKELTINNGVSKPIKGMLMEVIELKASNWGQFTNVMMMRGDSNSLDSVSQFSNVPVFYSPEGNPIPIEQMGYYFDNEFGDYVPYSTDDDNSDYQYSVLQDSEYDDGMDDEMQKAFEKFLLETEGSQ